MKILLLSGILACITLNSSAQSTAHFRVGGNCDMCKKRIEQAADIKGVKNAVWDAKTLTLEISFNPDKVKQIQIEQEIARVGHDTEHVQADSLAFEKLHNCCHYERLNYDESKD